VWSVPRLYKQNFWSNELVVGQSSACKNLSTKAHCSDPSSGNDWSHSRMKRFCTCCSELQSVWIGDRAIINFSYDLFNKPNYQSKPHIYSLIHVTIRTRREARTSYGNIFMQVLVQADCLEMSEVILEGGSLCTAMWTLQLTGRKFCVQTPLYCTYYKETRISNLN
jgi:hypothetical protein